MAIHSINNIQNSSDYQNKENKYILESLANLGQRYSVKGDSIKIGELSLYNFFTDKGVNINAIPNLDKLVCVINKVDDAYSLSLVYDYDITNNEIINPISLSDSSKIDFIESLNGSDISIKYNSIHFKVTDAYYEYYCKQTFGVKNKLNYLIERVNKFDNTLKYGLRIYNGHGIQGYENSYIILELIQDSFNKESYLLNVYLKNTDDIVNEDEFWFTNDNNTGFLENHDIDNPNFEAIGINNPTIYGSISFDGKNFEGYNLNDFESEFNGISTLLYDFIYDLKLLYLEAKEKYSVDTYGDINSIYKQILISLFEKIVFESSTSTAVDKIYIPFVINGESNPDLCEYYSIKYAYNSNSQNDIYFSNQDIQVKYVSAKLDSDWFELNIDLYRDCIICHTEGSDRVIFFNFEVDKDEDNEDLTVGINTSVKSILPYIDENGYWVLNGISTGVSGIGKDAGNPNIIIVESKRVDNSIDYNILAGAKKEELLETLSWESKPAYIEPLEKINLDSLSFKSEFDYFIVDYAIPNLLLLPEKTKQNTLEHLSNSIIINIADLSCVELNEYNSTNNLNYTKDDIYEIYGNYGVITTIWVYDSEKKEYVYLKKKNNPIAAADFNYISNINNLIQYAVKNVEPIHPDNYEFTYLVFDSTYATLKNNEAEAKSYIYPNIINKLSSQYNIPNYNNDLNFTFRYNDTIFKSDKNRKIDSISQSGNLRYFNTTYNDPQNNNTNIVTNSLYSYYDSENGTSNRYEEYVPNYNIPSLDLSEVLTRNETLLNRLNILSFDKYGTSYLSYIGTSVEDTKNILKVGTSNTNVNIGTDTMVFNEDRSKFVKQNELSIEFDDIRLTGRTDIENTLYVKDNITTNGVVWTNIGSSIRTNSVISNTSYNTTVFTPSSRYIYELNDNYNISEGIVNIETGNYHTVSKYVKNNLSNLLSYDLYNWCTERNKLYTICTTLDMNTEHYMYFSDGIYIPELLYQIGLSNYVINLEATDKITTANIDITSNMEIIKLNDSPILLLSTATNLYPDKFMYNYRRDINTEEYPTAAVHTENISNFTYSIFTGNPLKITYYIGMGKLHLHVEELYGNGKLNTTSRLVKEYFD